MSVILAKMIFGFFNEKEIRKIVDDIYKPIMILRQSSDVGVLTIIRIAMSYQYFDSFIYIFVCISVSATTFLLADIDRHELPIRGVFPINATISPNYEVIYAIEIYAIIINCWWVYSFDVVLLSLVRWMTIDLKILQLNYRQCQFYHKPRGTLMVTREGFDAVKNYSLIEELKKEDEIYSFVPFDEDQVNVKVDSFLKRFTSCLIHQLQIIKNINDVNNLFSVVLAIQTISNCTLTCMGLFGLVRSIKKHTNPANDIVMLQIGFLNLLYWSVFGHMLIVQHDCLMDSIYECGWEDHICSKNFVQVMTITIIQTMRPMVITAGHFFDLSMKTYLRVINKSYSFFAILNTATTEEDFQ
ncbi:uncharacterized protein LOC123270476 [Cotesia glomerata]|uniref:uncharacterized protein LOC123270476 n=1 Tax=Cotesia glomerata TaxID=32391 RepID=UPI001D02BCB6|nr:uncharacterized protein LOC123270476 [Cotesia glomerata]